MAVEDSWSQQIAYRSTVTADLFYAAAPLWPWWIPGRSRLPTGHVPSRKVPRWRWIFTPQLPPSTLAVADLRSEQVAYGPCPQP
ncbi:hypothetical protein V5799_030945 [Amblyomma americanum]|uniref:Uncharacterized protein n=1 Tax=Amblyomma americanum TaxID=6943 RepID=A0AAQ4EMA8_AMBAM